MQLSVILVFLGILVSLGCALFFLLKDKGNSNRMVYALGLRVGLSIALFLFVLLAHHQGWIQSTGLPLR